MSVFLFNTSIIVDYCRLISWPIYIDNRRIAILRAKCIVGTQRFPPLMIALFVENILMIPGSIHKNSQSGDNIPNYVLEVGHLNRVSDK